MAYTTLATLKTYLGIKTGTLTDDDMLSGLIVTAQAMIEADRRRTFEASADTTRTFDAVEDVDGEYLWIDVDLCAITEVANGDGTEVTASQYTTDPRNFTPYWRLKLLNSSGLAWTYTTDPEDAISITGKWAYSETAPADIADSCKQLAAYLYRSKDSMGDVVAYPDSNMIEMPAGIPKTVRMILDRYPLPKI